MLVRHRSGSPATSSALREASGPQPEPVCGEEEAARHLALPEGSDEEKDCAFKHGQLGSTEPGPVLPRALQGVGTVWRGPLAAHRACLHQLPGCCPPDSCCRLRAMCGAAPMMYQSWLGSGFYLLSSSPLYLPRCGTRALPRPLKNETQSPPSCVHSFLSFKVLLSLLQGRVCVLVMAFALVNEAGFAEVFINKCRKVEKKIWNMSQKKNHWIIF